MDFLTITATLKQIKSKKISIDELSKIFIKRIKDNIDINAFIYFDEENIINQVKKVERIKDDLPLKGIPLAIKDLFE